MKYLGALLLLLLAAAAGFGFLATFEPLEGASRLVFRTVYGVVAAAALLGCARLLLGGRRPVDRD